MATFNRFLIAFTFLFLSACATTDKRIVARHAPEGSAFQNASLTSNYEVMQSPLGEAIQLQHRAVIALKKLNTEISGRFEEVLQGNSDPAVFLPNLEDAERFLAESDRLLQKNTASESEDAQLARLGSLFSQDVLTAVTRRQKVSLNGYDRCECPPDLHLTSMLRVLTIEQTLFAADAMRATEKTSHDSLKVARLADATIARYLETYLYLASVRIEKFRYWNESFTPTFDDLAEQREAIQTAREALTNAIASDFDFRDLEPAENHELTQAGEIQHFLRRNGYLDLQLDLIDQLPDPLSASMASIDDALDDIKKIKFYGNLAADHDRLVARSRNEEHFYMYDLRGGEEDGYYWEEAQISTKAL